MGKRVMRINEMPGDPPRGRRRGNDLGEVAAASSDVGRPLAGRRVLVAEDNVILSMHVAHVLEGAGAEVLGPYPFADEALSALDAGACDAAVLDHELMDSTSEGVADRLAQMGVPYAYFTSHEASEVAGARDGVPVLSKPNDAGALLGAVSSILRG